MRTRFHSVHRSLGLAIFPAVALLSAASLLAGPPARQSGARSTDESLSLVPADAASVAVVRLDDRRSSTLAGKLFSDADHLTADGDAARFLEDARLNVREDVDTVVSAGMPVSGSTSGVLAVVEGRFDPSRLSAAAETRGAVKKDASGASYYLLPEHAGSNSNHGPSAVAFVSSHLVIGGSESAVVAALEARSGGGTGFASGTGLGSQLSRIDRTASLWALVDVARYPSFQTGIDRSQRRSQGSDTSSALLGAMKSVTFFAFQASVHGDGIDIAASGVTKDADTRQLLEDSLRGVVAILRLAVQDKQPELVSVLRQFRVSNSGDAVTISGSLPGSALRTLTAKHTASASR
jgi:hypothetical protein